MWADRTGCDREAGWRALDSSGRSAGLTRRCVTKCLVLDGGSSAQAKLVLKRATRTFSDARFSVNMSVVFGESGSVALAVVRRRASDKRCPRSIVRATPRNFPVSSSSASR